MATYRKPQFTIQQEFAVIPSAIVEPLQTCIIGPSKRVYEYTDASDKAVVSYGEYDYTEDNTFNYLGLPTAAVVDEGTVELYVEELWARYARLTSSATRGSAANRIVLTTNSFVASTGYARNSAFGTRDVRVGDKVRVTAGNSITLDTRVAALASTPTAATAAAFAAGSGNLTTRAASATATVVTASGSPAHTVSSSAALYVGNPSDGVMTDTYVVTCTTAGVGGTRQVETATVGASAVATTGNALVTVTTGGVSRIVSVAVTAADATNAIATKIRAALAADYVIDSLYTVSGSTSGVVLTLKSPAANDATINIAIAANGTGITAVPTSADTTAGVASVARFSVTSLNGDNVADFGATAIGSAFFVGTLGLTATIAVNSGAAAYVADESYSIVAVAEYTTSVPVITGNASSYTGALDTIYTLKVVTGGLWTTTADTIRVSASTSNGVDYSASTPISTPTVTGQDVSFALGSLGLTIKFPVESVQNALVTGETFTVAVTASAAGPINQIILSDPLDASIAASAAITTLDLHIYKESLQIPASGYPSAGSQALTTTEEDFTVTAALEITDSTWVDGAGDLIPIPVIKGNIIAPYEALLTVGTNSFDTISELSEVETVLGKPIPANPLAYGVYKALENSAGQPINYVSVLSDDVEGFTSALIALEQSEEAYFIVPLSTSAEVQSLYKAHVLSMSGTTHQFERVLLVSRPLSATEVKYGAKTTGGYWQGYIAANSAGAFKLLTIPDADFLTDGLRAGDSVRINFSVDQYGVENYDTYVLASVTDNQNAVLVSGPAVAYATSGAPNRIDIVRNLTRTEQAESLAATSGAFDNRRVYSVWPDLLVDDAGREVPGHFLACSIAGLKSSVAPHQGITNYSLNGWSSVARSYRYFTPTQLNVAAAGGTFIVTQDATGGEVYIRHQISSDPTDANTAQLSITTNLDSITKFIRGDLKNFIGKYNSGENFERIAHAIIAQKISYLQTQTSTVTAGPQVTSFDVASLVVKQDPLIRTTVNAKASIGLPYPVDNFDFVLTVI